MRAQNIILDKTAQKRILMSKKYLIDNNLDIGDKLLILQVFSQIKPAASFDYIDNDNRKSLILAILKKMHLYSQTIEFNNITKIIFGRKDNVSQLKWIHDDVFNKVKSVEEYGRLLGYPSCCLRSNIDPYTDEMNLLFNRYSSLPLIFHSPCSTDCKESVSLAKKVLKAYFLFDKKVCYHVISELKKPILKFNENMFIRFNDYKIRSNHLSYSYVSITVPSPIDEKTNKEKTDDVLEFFKKIKKGNLLYFNKDCLNIFYDEKLLAAKTFADNESYELLNFKV